VFRDRDVIVTVSVMEIRIVHELRSYRVSEYRIAPVRYCRLIFTSVQCKHIGAQPKAFS
jgi:hypothetical protein